MTVQTPGVGPVVANSSPLIALAHVGRLEFLHDLLGEIAAPTAVAAEVAPELPVLPPWIKVSAPTQPLAAQVLAVSLGPGEREAISLALERSARRVLLDERPARRLAAALGLPVVGTLGLVLAFKRRGLVPEVKPILDELIAKGFRVTPRLLQQVLNDAGE